MSFPPDDSPQITVPQLHGRVPFSERLDSSGGDAECLLPKLSVGNMARSRDVELTFSGTSPGMLCAKPKVERVRAWFR
jgi:hypothetical protein